jgi:Domain of unknown function (DUF4189)
MNKLILTLLLSTAVIAPARAENIWGAIAAGTSRDSSGSHVAVGFASSSSRLAAKSEAINQCLGGNPNVDDCKVVNTWLNGCGFVTWGRSSSNAMWGSGPTRRDAIENCLSVGEGDDSTCGPKVLGGCLNGY